MNCTAPATLGDKTAVTTKTRRFIENGPKSAPFLAKIRLENAHGLDNVDAAPAAGQDGRSRVKPIPAFTCGKEIPASLHSDPAKQGYWG